MKRVLKQYKNLILLVTAVILVALLIAADPLGFCTQRAHDRAAIRNQMEIEKAQTEREIAIIQAQTEAEVLRISTKNADICVIRDSQKMTPENGETEVRGDTE